MATPTEENYLKALYSLTSDEDLTNISDLSIALGVSKPTVNSMVKNLQKQGWVDYKRYKPLSLTPEGKKQAALVIRKHRLTEMFLVNKMGFGWEEVHDIAEQVEHIDAPDFFERMDELLGFPTVDPHGSPIPNKEGSITKQDYRQLSDLQEGDQATLCGLTNNSKDLLLFLNDKGIKVGTEILIHRIEPFDRSVYVSYDQHPEEVLTYEVARCLLVK